MANVTVIPATRNLHTGIRNDAVAKRKTAGYARVSTDSEEQLTSYEAQVDYYTNYIKSRPEWEFAGVYTDEGISATDTRHRDGFNKMVQNALDGKIDLIVTKSVSRFARNTVDSLTTVRKLKEKGVEVYFQKENIYTLDSKGELLITIMSSLAQEESRSISENVTWGKRKRFADGKVSLAYSSFLGYRKGEDGQMEIVPEEAETVRLIYRLFMEGQTPYAIAKYLTDRNIPTPTGKETWRHRTVENILSNEKYKGDARLQECYTVDFLSKKRKANLAGDVKICGSNIGEVTVATTNADGSILEQGKAVAKGNGSLVELEIPDAKLWSDETPLLYQCHVILSENGAVMDEVTEDFGIRMIEWSNRGLFINGKETLLRGGCVHHDNGILGAAAFAKSEERRVRIVKEVGFNAIRSAHNPASRQMLEACDRYGMYVMDETFDMWYNRKNKYDYGCDFSQWWEKDTAAMVERDINHPSVILYSIGNEVAEPFEEKGIQTGKAQIDLIHRLDGSRPVTCGVNLMILGRAAKGNGIYQDGETNTVASGKKKKEKKESQNASLAFNIMASFIGTGMNKGGNSPKVDAIATPFVDSLDIAGYNYGFGRYPLEEKAHPNRVVFGSETFTQDIAKNWAMVKNTLIWWAILCGRHGTIWEKQGLVHGAIPAGCLLTGLIRGF